MTWFRVDDKLHDHTKVMRAGHEAMGLWVLAASWSAGSLTDGWVPHYAAARLAPNADELAARLVKAGLWHEHERDGDVGWLFHEWSTWQQTREQVEAKRDAARERARKAREVRAKSTRSRREVRSTDTDTDTDKKHTRDDVALVPDDFDRFWSSYPKKVGKKAAEKAWAKARADEQPSTILAGLSAAVAAWRACGTEARFIPNPATWLNQGRWADEQQLPSGDSSTPAPLPVDPDDPEPDVRADPDAHLAWRKRRAAQRQGASA